MVSGKRASRLVPTAVCLVLAAGCFGEDTELVQRKLDVILQDDLATIVEDIPVGSRPAGLGKQDEDY